MKKVFGTMEDMIKAVAVGVVVDGKVYQSARVAAKMIAEAEGKNKDTIRKEIQRMLQGKREPWSMYGKYFISRVED